MFEVPGRILEDFLAGAAGPVGTFEIVARVPEGSGRVGSGPDCMTMDEESKGEAVETADDIEKDSGDLPVGSEGTGSTADPEVLYLPPVRLVSSWVSVRVASNLAGPESPVVTS